MGHESATVETLVVAKTRRLEEDEKEEDEDGGENSPTNSSGDNETSAESSECPECPTKICEEVKAEDLDDVAVVLHEKALIGIILAAVLGPLAFGALAIQW